MSKSQQFVYVVYGIGTKCLFFNRLATFLAVTPEVLREVPRSKIYKTIQEESFIEFTTSIDCLDHSIYDGHCVGSTITIYKEPLITGFNTRD